MATPERRRAILDAATRLFAHYGHAKMTIADIAREANVAVGSVYNEFDSKDAIVEALSGAAHVEVLDAMHAALRRKASSTFAERFTAVLVARTKSFALLRERGQHACELVHCRADGVTAAKERYREQERAIFRRLIEDGEASGEAAAQKPDRAAALVQRALASLSPPWIFSAEGDVAGVTLELAQLLLEGLSARDRSSSMPAARGSSRRKNER
jgi:AcrR family transcriptional regulator